MIQRIKKFIFQDLWDADLEKQPKWQSILFKQLRIVMIGAKGFQENKIQEKASALTYYTLLSIVPTLAMAFGIAKGFGLEERMRESIKDTTESNREIWEKVMEFAESMLANTQGGLIAGIGIVVLLWSVMKLLISIEESLNDIWEIRKGRSVARKVTDYLAMMILAPILLLLSGSLTVFIQSQFELLSAQFALLGFFGPIVHFLIRFSPYFFTWILFTLLYTVMPNTRVKIGSAIVAAIIAGTGFQFFEWLYITLQIGVSRYNAIYGSFAALPLFLIWMQTSWLIVLIGAEISFANQNVEHFQFEDGKKSLSVSALKKLTAFVMYHIIQKFIQEKPPQTAEEISNETGTPVRIVRQALFKLQQGGFIAETPTGDERTTAYMPAKDVHNIYLADINATVEKSGLDSVTIKNNLAVNRVTEKLENMQAILKDSKQNVLLKDL